MKWILLLMLVDYIAICIALKFAPSENELFAGCPEERLN